LVLVVASVIEDGREARRWSEAAGHSGTVVADGFIQATVAIDGHHAPFVGFIPLVASQPASPGSVAVRRSLADASRKLPPSNRSGTHVQALLVALIVLAFTQGSFLSLGVYGRRRLTATTGDP
jgi:hypothetical protein